MNIYFRDKIKGIDEEINNYKELKELISPKKNYFILANTPQGSKSLLIFGEKIPEVIDSCFKDTSKLVISTRL